MFAPPPVLPTTVWARLPDEFGADPARAQAAAHRFPDRPRSFLEGPAFDRDGNLYVVDIPQGRIFRVAPDRCFTLAASYDGEPNGLAIHNDGTIYIADHRLGILRLDPATGALTPVLTEIGGSPLLGPNDLTFSDGGDLYFTDQGATGLSEPFGRVVCLRADGHVDVLLDCVPSPNGLVLNRAETILSVAVTRSNAIWRVPLGPRGTCPTKVGVSINLSGGNGPDGLAMDENDTLFVAHHQLGVVWGFDRRGVPIHRIESCEGDGTTNMAFGGPDARSLFITESHSGTLLRAELPVPGRTLFSHRDLPITASGR